MPASLQGYDLSTGFPLRAAFCTPFPIAWRGGASFLVRAYVLISAGS